MCSGQVAVGVLLSIHALQILLLYQDVDAFLTETQKKKKRHMGLSSRSESRGGACCMRAVYRDVCVCVCVCVCMCVKDTGQSLGSFCLMIAKIE